MRLLQLNQHVTMQLARSINAYSEGVSHGPVEIRALLSLIRRVMGGETRALRRRMHLQLASNIALDAKLLILIASVILNRLVCVQ